jgi:hypothetical protein
VYALSAATGVNADLSLVNVALTDAEIVEAFARALTTDVAATPLR